MCFGCTSERAALFLPRFTAGKGGFGGHQTGRTLHSLCAEMISLTPSKYTEFVFFFFKYASEVFRSHWISITYLSFIKYRTYSSLWHLHLNQILVASEWPLGGTLVHIPMQSFLFQCSL